MQRQRVPAGETPTQLSDLPLTSVSGHEGRSGLGACQKGWKHGKDRGDIRGGPSGLDWGGVRDLVGLQQAVILQETEKVLRGAVRDLVRSEVTVMKAETGEVLLRPP